MGDVIPLFREFRPDAQEYNCLAQVAAAEYLTKLQIYGAGTQTNLQYQLAFRNSDGKLVTVTLTFSLEGVVTETRLAAHYQDVRRSQAEASRIARAVSGNDLLGSIGDHVVFWQHALHELFHSHLEWERWLYYLSSPEETGWILASM